MIFAKSSIIQGNIIKISSEVKSNTPKRIKKNNKKKQKQVDSAVHNFIRAWHCLGRKTINLGAITKGLEIPHNQVEQSIIRLQSNGIKINKL